MWQLPLKCLMISFGCPRAQATPQQRQIRDDEIRFAIGPYVFSAETADGIASFVSLIIRVNSRLRIVPGKVVSQCRATAEWRAGSLSTHLGSLALSQWIDLSRVCRE